jgi:hypothetical protein
MAEHTGRFSFLPATHVQNAASVSNRSVRLQPRVTEANTTECGNRACKHGLRGDQGAGKRREQGQPRRFAKDSSAMARHRARRALDDSSLPVRAESSL